MFHNLIKPLALWYFVEPQRLWLVAGTDKENGIFAVFFNPFPLRDFPYLTTFAGAEKITPLQILLPLMRHEPQALWLYG